MLSDFTADDKDEQGRLKGYFALRQACSRSVETTNPLHRAKTSPVLIQPLKIAAPKH
jgi:hypothetical protein